jgi:hypothetical protein
MEEIFHNGTAQPLKLRKKVKEKINYFGLCYPMAKVNITPTHMDCFRISRY